MELLLSRFAMVSLIAVVLALPARFLVGSFAPALKGVLIVVDDRGPAVGGTLVDDDAFLVVRVYGTPPVRFLFDVGQGTLFWLGRGSHTVS